MRYLSQKATQKVVPSDCSHTQTAVYTQRSPVTADCCIPRHEGVSDIQLAQRAVLRLRAGYRQIADAR